MPIIKEKVLKVEHYTDRLFHITTTRDPSIRFRDGEFLMIGIMWDDKPLLRAYSVASPSHQDTLEFFSIKVPGGPLTSRLQYIKPGDELLVNSKAVGTLVCDNLKPGRTLYLMGTGTGVAPFLSVARGFEAYENYEKVVLLWGARTAAELPFVDYWDQLNEDETYGELTQGKFMFYPTATREDYRNTGRITDAMYEGKVQQVLGLEPFDKEHDRVMICGSHEMNMELRKYFIEDLGCTEGNANTLGEFVLEKAFVD